MRFSHIFTTSRKAFERVAILFAATVARHWLRIQTGKPMDHHIFALAFTTWRCLSIKTIYRRTHTLTTHAARKNETVSNKNNNASWTSSSSSLHVRACFYLFYFMAVYPPEYDGVAVLRLNYPSGPITLQYIRMLSFVSLLDVGGAAVLRWCPDKFYSTQFASYLAMPLWTFGIDLLADRNDAITHPSMYQDFKTHTNTAPAANWSQQSNLQRPIVGSSVSKAVCTSIESNCCKISLFA